VDILTLAACLTPKPSALSPREREKSHRSAVKLESPTYEATPLPQVVRLVGGVLMRLES